MTHRLYVLKACEALCKSCDKDNCAIKCDLFMRFKAHLTKAMYNEIVVRTNAVEANRKSVERYHNDPEFRKRKIKTATDWFARYPGYRKWYQENYKKGVSVSIKDWLKLHPEQR